MTTAYITHPDCLRHEMGPGHPESPARLSAIGEHMRASGMLEEVRSLEAPLADADDLKRVHRSAYVDLIFENAPNEGYVQLDPDTAMNAYSLSAARRAAGAGLLAVDEIMAGRSANAFCAVRPCGHHATQLRSMGFCIFNNIGVAAAYALEKKGLERVAIIDFDVHHGNGTEDMFSQPKWRDRVLMASFFQHPFYPYSGTVDPAPNMINVPLAAGSGGAAAKQAIETQWLPALETFKPQMILISAGFDAHREDLLGGMALVEDDYAWMTRELMALAARHSQQRVVSMLEGGYNLAALGRSVVAHVKTLAEH
ncbi:MAG TPA: histone deacetylase family protein [Steroidobacteraceae bacterium]|nr:histone deacetylase family protein [Steroidobacteraceae bacterium]